MTHRRLLLLAALACPLVACEQEGSEARAPDASPADRGLPEIEARPDGAPPVMIAPPDPCEESQAIDFVALAVPAADGALAYEGQLQDDAGFVGSCGGGGSEAYDQVVRFEAPEAGVWQFLLTPRALLGQAFANYDPVLHARSTCEDPEAEVACNDDIASGRLESRLRLELAAGEQVYLVVDTVGRAINARYELSARRLPIVEVGDPCDVASARNGCPNGSYCRTEPDIRGPEGVCAPDDPPVITELSAFARGDVLGLVAAGTDTGADVEQAYLNLLDAEGGIIVLNAQGADTYILTPATSIFGQDPFEFRFSSDLLAGFPQTAAIEVRLLDARGNESEPARAEPVAAELLEPDAACDEDRIRDACPEQTACLDPGDGFACLRPTAPRLTRATGYYDPATLLTGYRVSGVDPDQDVVGVRLEMLDDGGATVASGDLALDFIEWDAERFTGLVSVQLNRERGPVDARLIPFDAEGLRGQPLRTGPLVAPLTVDAGATCDPLGAQARCGGDALCFQPDPASLPECGVPEAACPEAWGPTVDLNAWDEGDAWRYAGDLTTRYNVTRGSCGGGSAQTIFTFTAPEAGRYSFVTWSRAGGADTVLYARSHCGYDPARADVELGCNDDVSVENQFSLVTLELGEGESTFVIVDGGNNGEWRGPFTLTARRQP